MFNGVSAMIKSFSKVVLATALSAMTVSVFAAPVTYQIDPIHSAARFSYNHLGLSTQSSRFNTTTGTIVFDAAAKTGQVDVTIDTRSINTGSDVFNQHIQGKDFLDTATYPTATFKSTKINFEGDKPVSVDGNLTIKGITKPVTLSLSHFMDSTHPMMKKPVIGADAVAHIKRSEFNAGKYAPATSDDVTLTLSVEAVAQ
jgi:polyisoprenoid-binding protein YceI